MKSAARHSVAGILALAAVGCAFGDRHTTLVYPPAHAKMVTARAVQGNEPFPRPRVVLVRFVDRRMDKQRVGYIHNLNGIKTANVASLTSVTDWVMSAFQTELANAGFDVSVAETPAGRVDEIVVTGAILRVLYDTAISGGGKVEIAVKATGNGSVVLERTYKGQGSEADWKGSAESFGESLSQALEVNAQTFAAELWRELPVRRLP